MLRKRMLKLNLYSRASFIHEYIYSHVICRAECCLIADTIQFFKDREIDFCPSNVVTDILGSIRDTHLSGKFHRIVSDNPERYFDPNPHLKTVLLNLKDSGKRLIFAR